MVPTSRLASTAVLIAVATVIAVGVVIGRGATAEGSRRPTRDDLVLEHVPSLARDPVAREARSLQRRLLDAPGDLASAVRLARLHVDEARRRADPRELGYAEAALHPWWATAAAPPSVLLLRATIKQSRHDFGGALEDLDRLLAVQPDDAQAWLTRAVVLTVRGRYAEALESCARLEALAPALVRQACQAPLDALTGHLPAARRDMEAALGQTQEPRDRAWAHSILGELAQWAGDGLAAEAHLGEALRLDPDDRYARAVYADLLLDAGRAGEAAALLAGREADDGMLLRLAIAEAALGTTRAPELASALRERFAASRRRGELVHQREEARFALAVEKDPARALVLAQEGWELQHEPWDARLLLEAAVAAGSPAGAAPALDWLSRTGFESPGLRRLAQRAGR